MALNGALYPTGSSIPPVRARRAQAAPANEPIAKKALPTVANRPVTKGEPRKMDARILANRGSRSARCSDSSGRPACRRPKSRKAKWVTEGDDRVLVFRKAWEPGAEVTPWLFQLGSDVRGKGFDTNIPARSH